MGYLHHSKQDSMYIDNEDDYYSLHIFKYMTWLLSLPLLFLFDFINRVKSMPKSDHMILK